jgi:formylglycine-generating enzyme required for sulfatase activity
MAEGKAAEKERRWIAARNAYREAASLDPDHRPAGLALKRMERILPAPSKKWGDLFLLPDADRDQHGNPIVERKGHRKLPGSGLPYELWLKEPRMELVLVLPGSYRMGSSQSEKGRFPSEGPAHRVEIDRVFYLGKYEVTQAQWGRVMENNPSAFPGSSRPVEKVSWQGCRDFVHRLATRVLAEAVAGCEFDVSFRLPSEAEWEYACRAGSRTRFSAGDAVKHLDRVGWFKANAEGRTREVGRKEPNAWGLYDLHGNVWEWCEDGWSGNYAGAGSDARPVPPELGNHYRVARGGSWFDLENYCRSATRFKFTMVDCVKNVGFRLVVEPRAR